MAGQERSDEIDVKYAPPNFRTQLPGHGVSTGDTRVIDKNVDFSVSRGGRLGGRANGLLARDVNDNRGHLSQGT